MRVPSGPATGINSDQKSDFAPTDGTRLQIDHSGNFGGSPILSSSQANTALDRLRILHRSGHGVSRIGRQCFVATLFFAAWQRRLGAIGRYGRRNSAPRRAISALPPNSDVTAHE